MIPSPLRVDHILTAFNYQHLGEQILYQHLRDYFKDYFSILNLKEREIDYLVTQTMYLGTPEGMTGSIFPFYSVDDALAAGFTRFYVTSLKADRDVDGWVGVRGHWPEPLDPDRAPVQIEPITADELRRKQYAVMYSDMHFFEPGGRFNPDDEEHQLMMQYEDGEAELPEHYPSYTDLVVNFRQFLVEDAAYTMDRYRRLVSERAALRELYRNNPTTDDRELRRRRASLTEGDLDYNSWEVEHLPIDQVDADIRSLEADRRLRDVNYVKLAGLDTLTMKESNA